MRQIWRGSRLFCLSLPSAGWNFRPLPLHLDSFFFFRLNQRFKSHLTNWPRLFTKYFPPNLVSTLSHKSVTPTCYLYLFVHRFALLESIHTDQCSFPSHAFCSPLQTVKQPCIIILYLGGTNLDIACFFLNLNRLVHLSKTEKTIIIEFSMVKSIL